MGTELGTKLMLVTASPMRKQYGYGYSLNMLIVYSFRSSVYKKITPIGDE